MQIRQTTPADRDSFAAVCAAAGLSTPAEAIRFYLDHPDIITYVAEANGTVVGTGAATSFGNRSGWLGAIAVLPEHQGRGVGRTLTEWGQHALRDRGVKSVVLLASARGRNLYERMGYKAGTDYLVLEGQGRAWPPNAANLRPLMPRDWEEVLALDFGATGEQRSDLLRAMGPGYVAVDRNGHVIGYHATAPWGGGPAAAVDPDTGRLLLDLMRGLRGREAMTARVPEVNRAALAHLQAEGFAETYRCTYMVLGPWPEPYRPERLWGLFSFALG